MENLNEEEIDLIALLKKLWFGKGLIIRTVLFFMFFGVVVALTSPLIYTSSSTFIPQSDTGSSSNLSGVASLVGINLGGISNGTEIPPSIYPKILESTSFKRELLSLRLENPDSVSKIKLYEYLKKNKGTDVIGLIKKYTVLLPFTILQAIKGDDKKELKNNTSKMFVGLEEERLFNKLGGILLLSVNKKEGFVTLSAGMDEPVIAALIAK